MTHPSKSERSDRNLKLFPFFVFLFHFNAWMPVFFLYFSDRVTLPRVLQLESIYYLAVVLLEVPSGYFSDRIGRKPTLIAAAGALVLAYVLFFIGSTFQVLVLAQICLAAGIAFNSGTDTSFHFDSLKSMGREDEYGRRESRIASLMLASGALSALGGGAIGLVGLRFSYGLSGITAAGAFVLSWLFTEPGKTDEDLQQSDQPFLKQLSLTFEYLKQPPLLWLFSFYVLAIILIHVPYEFYQPYLDILGKGDAFWAGATPLAAGVVTFLSQLVSTGVAEYSTRIKKALGLAGTLITSLIWLGIVIFTMGMLLHVAVVGLIVLRTLSKALYQAPLREAVTPLIGKAQRATYLSVQSLAGRLGFSATLLVLSFVAGGHSPESWTGFSNMLMVSSGIAIAGTLGLILTSGVLSGKENEKEEQQKQNNE